MKKIVFKIVSVILAMVLICGAAIADDGESTPGGGQTEARQVAGDANGDGNVTIADALITMQHVVKKTTVKDDLIALIDADGNGKVEMKDALLVLQLVVGKINFLPGHFDPLRPVSIDKTSLKALSDAFEPIREKYDPADLGFVLNTVDFYGIYSGGSVITAKMGNFDGELDPITVVVGKTEINCNSAIPLYFYKDGELILLSEAYDKGLITDKDVEEIAHIANYKFNVTPSAEREKELSDLYRELMDSAGFHKHPIGCRNYTVVNDDVEIFFPGTDVFTGRSNFETVAHKYVFSYNDSTSRYLVVHENKFYHLSEALEQGIISEDDVALFHFRLTGGRGEIGDRGQSDIPFLLP